VEGVLTHGSVVVQLHDAGSLHFDLRLPIGHVI